MASPIRETHDVENEGNNILGLANFNKVLNLGMVLFVGGLNSRIVLYQVDKSTLKAFVERVKVKTYTSF